jgi:hypothetical protein
MLRREQQQRIAKGRNDHSATMPESIMIDLVERGCKRPVPKGRQCNCRPNVFLRVPPQRATSERS